MSCTHAHFLLLVGNRYVLYKEKNILLTELQLSRRRGLIFPQPERMKKVQKSMGAIRQVLGERKRVKIAAFREQQQQQQPKSEEPAMNFHE
jgi:Mitochondrial 39-S ribosomal protein L47 (MRP-L47)